MLLATLLIAAGPVPHAAPAWAAQVVGLYVGRDHNRSELQCEQVEFFLRDGALIGHYRVADDPPLEGDLTDFIDDGSGVGGRFTWTDRDGSGVRSIRFARDFTSFFSLWGKATPDPRLTGYGLRGADAVVPGCESSPVS